MADGLILEPLDLGPINEAVRKASVETQFVVAAALYEAMLDVMDEAKELCPVDTGALRDSGSVGRVNVRGGVVSVELSFGVTPHLDYATDQHENLLYNHAPGKQAKFLEQPLLNWVSSGGPEEVVKDAEDYLGTQIR